MPGNPARRQVLDIWCQWRPGSGNHDWATERDDLWSRHPEQMRGLVALIRTTGRVPGPPIVLGDDGRVWDGHHRIVAAMRACIGLVDVDVEYGHTAEPTPVWWAISGDEILNMLRRVAAGEDPDLVYTEFYANCDVTRPGDEEAPDA